MKWKQLNDLFAPKTQFAINYLSQCKKQGARTPDCLPAARAQLSEMNTKENSLWSERHELITTMIATVFFCALFAVRS